MKMINDLQKIKEYLLVHENAKKDFEQDYFKLAICEIILENHPKANSLLNESIRLMLGKNPYWIASSQPNWLVDIVTLSGQENLYETVINELSKYRLSSTKTHQVGDSPLTHYSFSVMEILYPHSNDIGKWINNLIKHPKYKIWYYAGYTLQAIIDRDQNSFETSIKALLKSHESKAKYGDLRWSPEGWLCLPAMTLAFIAIHQGLTVDFKNDYISKGYLSFLQSK